MFIYNRIKEIDWPVPFFSPFFFPLFSLFPPSGGSCGIAEIILSILLNLLIYAIILMERIKEGARALIGHILLSFITVNF
jgi:hypothetical protein